MKSILSNTNGHPSTFIVTFVLFIMLTGCKQKVKEEKTTDEVAMTSEEELYRPNYHFTPKKGWMNDPNGMFYFNGYYHLYYQHYPDDNVWGPMHWGHAISTDMIDWKEQPIALYPDELGYIFSGSAVADVENTSGFSSDGKVPIVAMYTSHDPKKAEEDKIDVETQSIAYSLDEGLTYTKYEGNPVIENPGIRDFRDPKVSWDKIHKKWIMVLAADDKTMFYESKNLKEWNLLSDFGQNIGAHGGVWECPDFFPLKVQGSDEVKWVHLVSVNPGGPNGGSATQYFIGEFDGKKFTIDKNFKEQMQEKHDFWVDFGKDNYAGVTWSNIVTKDGGKFFIGWMSNWEYANKVPTIAWRSAMTAPRELKLVKTPESFRLVFEPVDQLATYKANKFLKDNIKVKEKTDLIGSKEIDLSSAEIQFDIAKLPETGVKFKLYNAQGDELLFGYDAKDKHFYIDRSHAGKTEFSEKFGESVSIAPRVTENEGLKGTILLDKTSIELFYDDGKTVMTEIFFPNAPLTSLSIAAENQEFTLDSLQIYELKFN